MQISGNSAACEWLIALVLVDFLLFGVACVCVCPNLLTACKSISLHKFPYPTLPKVAYISNSTLTRLCTGIVSCSAKKLCCS